MIKRAFTMLELVFVVIILGIVSSIAASILANVYDNYLVQKSVHNISIKTELAVEQIANRLQFTLPYLTAARKPGTTVADYATVRALYRITGSDTIRTILEWIAYDNDSFSATTTPGWSGFADLNSSVSGGGTRSINSPGSALLMTNTIIRHLSRNKVQPDINLINNNPIIIFSDIEYRTAEPLSVPPVSSLEYDINCTGLGGTAVTVTNADSCANSITVQTAAPRTKLTFIRNPKSLQGDLYKLAWSAYALVPTNHNAIEKTFDLVLHSNYQPWNGDKYNDGATTKNTLIKNVTVFKFIERGNNLRFKLCAKEYITGTTDFVSACKEKVIIR